MKNIFFTFLKQAYADNLQQDAYYFYDIKFAEVISYLISYDQHGYVLSSRENDFRMISIKDEKINLYAIESDANSLDQFMLGFINFDYKKFR